MSDGRVARIDAREQSRRTNAVDDGKNQKSGMLPVDTTAVPPEKLAEAMHQWRTGRH
ncbi:hypothetical protein [Mesorhizobium sp. KR1-2]|uniref:hypothetical protein n=1 Tax=Mesorhizobium sp. KR1-2 TaxID=3156609 RepID=UPI0032B5AB89